MIGSLVVRSMLLAHTLPGRKPKESLSSSFFSNALRFLGLPAAWCAAMWGWCRPSGPSDDRVVPGVAVRPLPPGLQRVLDLERGTCSTTPPSSSSPSARGAPNGPSAASARVHWSDFEGAWFEPVDPEDVSYSLGPWTSSPSAFCSTDKGDCQQWDDNQRWTVSKGTPPRF